MREKSGGFTLVEWMIVGAIVGILASIAIPSFKRYQCDHGKRSACVSQAKPKPISHVDRKLQSMECTIADAEVFLKECAINRRLSDCKEDAVALFCD